MKNTPLVVNNDKVTNGLKAVIQLQWQHVGKQTSKEAIKRRQQDNGNIDERNKFLPYIAYQEFLHVLPFTSLPQNYTGKEDLPF